MQNVVNLYACITYPNEPSIAMHESMGYKFIGRFHAAGFKMGQWRDVSWFEKQISFPASPAPVIAYPGLDLALITNILKEN